MYPDLKTTSDYVVQLPYSDYSDEIILTPPLAPEVALIFSSEMHREDRSASKLRPSMMLKRRIWKVLPNPLAKTLLILCLIRN